MAYIVTFCWRLQKFYGILLLEGGGAMDMRELNAKLDESLDMYYKTYTLILGEPFLQDNDPVSRSDMRDVARSIFDTLAEFKGSILDYLKTLERKVPQ